MIPLLILAVSLGSACRRSSCLRETNGCVAWNLASGLNSGCDVDLQRVETPDTSEAIGETTPSHGPRRAASRIASNNAHHGVRPRLLDQNTEIFGRDDTGGHSLPRMPNFALETMENASGNLSLAISPHTRWDTTMHPHAPEYREKRFWRYVLGSKRPAALGGAEWHGSCIPEDTDDSVEYNVEISIECSNGQELCYKDLHESMTGTIVVRNQTDLSLLAVVSLAIDTWVDRAVVPERNGAQFIGGADLHAEVLTASLASASCRRQTIVGGRLELIQEFINHEIIARLRCAA